VAYFFLKDGYMAVAQSEPFEIRSCMFLFLLLLVNSFELNILVCEKQLMNGFAFLALMGCVAGVGMLFIIIIIIG
jgi:hypothetical protein